MTRPGVDLGRLVACVHGKKCVSTTNLTASTSGERPRISIEEKRGHANVEKEVIAWMETENLKVIKSRPLRLQSRMYLAGELLTAISNVFEDA